MPFENSSNREIPVSYDSQQIKHSQRPAAIYTQTQSAESLWNYRR
jgi:hypothetical protein